MHYQTACRRCQGAEITPVLDDPQDENDETLANVIGYLKTDLLVLRHAPAHGSRVAHGHSHHLDGTDA